MNIPTAVSMIEEAVGAYPEKPAFMERDGSVHSFGELLFNSRFMGAEMVRLGVAGRPVVILGEVDYGGICTVLGCLIAGCPVIPLNAGLPENELCSLMAKYEAGAVFISPKYSELACAVKDRFPELTVMTDLARDLSRKPSDLKTELPPADPGAPAFLFRTEAGSEAMVSHQNICSALTAFSSRKEIGSYTFLCPMNWGDAFDCTMGVLLPLTGGCCLIRRGEKRGVTRAIAESGATAFTCTNQQLRGLERSLRFRSEQNLSKTAVNMYIMLDRLSRLLKLDLRKRMRRQVRRCLGEKLRLIICGGDWPEWDSAQRFADWGIEVQCCYFIPECGPLALGEPSDKRLIPIADIKVHSNAGCGLGELFVDGDRMPIGYYNGKTDFADGFPTGDMGLLSEDGTLELRGRRKTMLYGRDGEPLFPEELAQIIKTSRFVADCTITGRFDTKTADVIVTAHITPDLREVRTAIGEKYSDNRLKLLFRKVMEKLKPSLPRRIDEFKIEG